MQLFQGKGAGAVTKGSPQAKALADGTSTFMRQVNSRKGHALLTSASLKPQSRCLNYKFQLVSRIPNLFSRLCLCIYKPETRNLTEWYYATQSHLPYFRTMCLTPLGVLTPTLCNATPLAHPTAVLRR